MKKVLISCLHLQRTIDRYLPLFAENGISIDLPKVNQKLTEAELLDMIQNYDGMIAGDDELTERVLSKAKRLKVISKWGVGIDGIDLEAANKYGITITNTPNVFNDEVADLTIGYIIALARKIWIIDRMVRHGEWNSAQLQGTSLRGKTLGIIGVGNIGKEVCRRAKAMGMNSLGYDIYPIAADFKSETGLIQTPLEDLLTKSDFISLHCNLTKDNYHLLDEKEFESMKDHVYIINTARGPLINEKILSEYLENGKIAGAALDVFEEEPLPGDSQLRKYENCIFGSHNSSDTLEAVMRVNERAISNLITGLDRE